MNITSKILCRYRQTFVLWIPWRLSPGTETCRNFMLCMILVILYTLFDYAYYQRSTCPCISHLVTYVVTADMTKIALWLAYVRHYVVARTYWGLVLMVSLSTVELFYKEDGSNLSFRNIDAILHRYTTSHTRRMYFWYPRPLSGQQNS